MLVQVAIKSTAHRRLGDLGQAAESLAIPGEALLQDHDPLEPALPFTNEQRAGLQCDALPSLWGATVEGDAGAIVLLGAKVPPDRFVRDRRKRLTGVDGRAPSLRASAGGGQALRRPNGRAIDGVVHRDRDPRDPPRSTERRHCAAAKPPTFPPSDASLPARIWLPCGPCRSCRPLRLGFGVTAAVHSLRLDHAIPAAGRGA